MRELHLFAGAGGGILGGILLGHTCVCAVEIEPYCRKVLLQRQRDGILPRFPIWDDVRTFDGKPWRGRVDVVCGGFPCQDLSSAGGKRGDGLDGKRSGLWVEMARLIYEIQPANVFIENSPMLVSRGIDRVLQRLASMGERITPERFTDGRESGFSLPTPLASDSKGAHSEEAITKMKARGFNPGLRDWFALHYNFLYPPVRPIEYLMGWPIGWTEQEPVEMDKYHEWLNSHGKP